LALQSNGSTGLTLDTSLNVGVGTTTPATKLVASGTTTALDSNGLILATVTDAVAANIGGQIMMGGYYTGTTPTAFGGIAAKKENGTSGSFSGYLQFLTSTGGSGNTEKGRFDSSGNLLVGATSVSGIGEKLNVTGFGILTQSAAGTNRALFGTFGGSNLIVGSFDSNPVELRTNNTARFLIGTAGQLGIGGATYGSSGQVLTSGGSGAAPTWATPSSTMTLISTQTASSSATLDWTGLSGYNSYILVISNLTGATSIANLLMRFGTGATTFVTSGYSNQVVRSSATNTVSAGTGSGSSMYASAFPSTSGYRTSAFLYLTGFTALTIASTAGTFLASNSNVTGVSSGGLDTGGVPITAIRLLFDSGQLMSSGTASLYGLST
jgi:hypothetical protein